MQVNWGNFRVLLWRQLLLIITVDCLVNWNWVAKHLDKRARELYDGERNEKLDPRQNVYQTSCPSLSSQPAWHAHF